MSKKIFVALDVGNTNTTIGVIQGDEVINVARLTTRLTATSDEWEIALRALPMLQSLDEADIIGSAICSVCPPVDNRLSRAVQRTLNVEPIILNPTGELPFTNSYRPPGDVGMDRLANVAAGLSLHNEPLIIVDFGTATTLDVLDQNKDYLGGVILPGIETTADSLYSRTSKLPQISIKHPKSSIGRTTVEAMTSGLFFSSVDAISGMISRIETELGTEAHIIATGGLAPLICAEISRVESVESDLTLRGIKTIWELQRA